MKSIFILGRQPAIGRAELESLFGAAHLEMVGEQALACDVPAEEIPFSRLGSSIRVAKVLTVLDTSNWSDIARHLIDLFPRRIQNLPPEGKLKLGLSAFELPVRTTRLLQTGLELKKACKKQGRSVRIVPNNEPALSSAQVLHNQLTGELGIEILLVRQGKKTWVAQTFAVQDINAYASRDQNRPKRDARVGMLPPKLAQTIVNLAAGNIPAAPSTTVLDPFCGTGVVLQEALLMGYDIYGTDLEPRMIDYTEQNLKWLENQLANSSPQFRLEVGDATDHRWQPAPDLVACEAYLGSPLSSWPKPERLQEIIGTCNVIIEKFLKNIAQQVPFGTRLCLAVPAWRSPAGKIRHLPLIDLLAEIGYNQVSFEYVRSEELVYYRPSQIVARQLVVITRK
jgi:tRNA G10  N-methylase Trm11